MTKDVIAIVIRESVNKVSGVLKDNLKKMILFGSCARGDYTDKSDIDIT